MSVLILFASLQVEQKQYSMKFGSSISVSDMVSKGYVALLV